MEYLEKVKLWKSNKNLDAKLKAELDSMDDNQLKEAFTNDLEFGTGGLRGILGAGTNRLNIYVVMKTIVYIYYIWVIPFSYFYLILRFFYFIF